MYISIQNGPIETDLFEKDTDRNQYLLRESCHPNGVTAPILFSLGLRINRICSTRGEQRLTSAGAYCSSVTKGLPRRISEKGHRKGQKSSKTEGPGKVENSPFFVKKKLSKTPCNTADSIKTLEIQDWGRFIPKRSC